MVTKIEGPGLSVKRDLFLWSNLLSISRFIIPIPIIWLHIRNGYQVNAVITLLILFGIFSDFLDGWVARRRGEVSELGKILDPVSDKTMTFLMFGYTVWLGWIPFWYFLVGVIRDLLILAGSAWIKFTRGKVAMAVMTGKISVNVMAIYWVSVFFFPEMKGVQSFLMILSLVMMLISLVHYFHRFNAIRQGADFN